MLTSKYEYKYLMIILIVDVKLSVQLNSVPASLLLENVILISAPCVELTSMMYPKFHAEMLW